MDCSDNNRCFICKKCGKMLTVGNKEKMIFRCARCKNTTNIAEIRTPYACECFPGKSYRIC